MYAAKLCSDVVYNGFDDWFLPSKDELELMYDNLYRAGLGGFACESYWSSSEYSDYASFVLQQCFRYDYRIYDSRDYAEGVRPIRAF